jgi:hypothetical protein
MKTNTIATLLLLLTVTPAICEDGRVTGTLSMPDGKPVGGYPVIISGELPSGEIHDWVSSTNAEGKFSVKQLPPGTYTAVPANEPGAVKSFQIDPTAQSAPDLELQVTPGQKF